ncbi:MAG: hypothetical protein JNK38_19730 [Acidobacteria bacterium]|nr:hypothetical protein [Acidobacteriota bacterium]
MITTLEFNEKYVYPSNKPGITLPVILTYGGLSYNVSAKVDPGSEVCLFKQEIALELNLPLENGLPITLDSLGSSIEAYGHEVILQTCGMAFTSFVYFAKYPGLRRNLLGRQGWLRQLRIAIVDYDNTLYLSRYYE